MIEQKDFLQLFGNWGYSVPDLRKRVEHIKDEAKSRDDRVGYIACTNLEAMCIFAETDDHQKAFRDVFSNIVSIHPIMSSALSEMGIDDETIKAIEGVIEDGIANGSYKKEDSVALLEAFYEAVCDTKSFEEALSYFRHKVMDSLGRQIFINIAKMAGETGEDIYEAMVRYSLSVYEKENGMPIVTEINLTVAKIFDEMVGYVIQRKVDILDLPSKINPAFPGLINNVVSLLYEDMPSRFDKLNFSIIDVPKIMPHRVFDFKIAFCFILSAFFVGVSLGIFSYDDYDDFLKVSGKKRGLLSFEDMNNIVNMRSN